MRNIFLAILFLSFTISPLIANDLPDELKPIHMKLGAFVNTRASISTVTIQGYKNEPAWAPLGDIGVSMLFLQRGSIGLMFNVSMSKYSYGIYPYKDDGTKMVTTITNSTFTFNPMLYLGGFVVGYNYYLSSDTDTDGSSYGPGPTLDAGEIIAGGLIPLYSDETGSFNLNILGSYMLDEIHTKIQPVSLSIGFSYIFNVTKY